MTAAVGEEWRPVVGGEGWYEVSSFGRVRSWRVQGQKPRTTRAPEPRVLNTRPTDGRGYLCVSVRHRSRLVHRIVLEAFVGPCPAGMECAHNDGNPGNNRLENLRWATPRDNNHDKLRHGTDQRGEAHPGAKLTRGDVDAIRALCRSGAPRKSISAAFGVSTNTIGDIAKGRTWREARP